MSKKHGKRKSPRWARVCLVTGIILVVLAGGGYAAANAVINHYADEIKTNDYLSGVPQGERASLPPSGAPVTGPLNILLLSSDNAGNARSKSQGVDGQRSDSLILFHVDKNFQHVYAFSLERDSYVSIPAAGSWNGGRSKLNAALAYGGPALTVRTVQNLLGIKIPYVAVVSFATLVKCVDAVGGVDVYIDNTTIDKELKRTWTKGWHHLNGTDAQFYVRQRHGLNGFDYDRMKRQQQLIRALMKKATTAGVLSNPFKLNDLITGIAASVQTQKGTPIKDLAFAARGLSLDAVTFSTLPTAGNFKLHGTSYERVDDTAASALGQAVNGDNLTSYFKRYPPNDASHGA